MASQQHGFDLVYTSFSGADIVASITVPVITNDPVTTPLGSTILAPMMIGNLHTISLSSHRDSVPVRSFKRPDPKGFTRGPRTVAGSLIFTMFDRVALAEVQNKVRTYYQNMHKLYAVGNANLALPNLIPLLKSDELPPFDVTITMANELGQIAYLKIIGVQIVTNGMVMGVDELVLEEQMSYIALGHETLAPVANQNTPTAARPGRRQATTLPATTLSATPAALPPGLLPDTA